ncbi:MAG: 2,3-bisphosphoglycerate-independent phosphoglycerate mutase [Phycisphaerae bacterium]|jgi:2,3-bisphosphoglycerate-independent phosphoglycerate mutase
MKHAIIIPSGAAGEALEELDGRTPLEAAALPTLDELAAIGRTGTARTVPTGMAPCGELTVLSVLGYDPRSHAVARGPLEALARGLPVGENDLVFRCNLVTVMDGRLLDLAAGYIDTVQAGQLLADLNEALEDRSVSFHAGRSYRGLFFWRDAGPLPRLRTTDPQGLVDQAVKRHLPAGAGSEPLVRMFHWAQHRLAEHDINAVRQDLGENPANAVWVYGQGPQAELPAFAERFGVRGAMVAGVDRVRGLARAVGWDVLDVPGATGLPDTDLGAKGRAAVRALDQHDVVCVHVEAADELSHAGEVQRKVALLEALDRDVVAPLYVRLRAESQYRLLVMPDHGTSVIERRHLAGPTVFLMAGTGIGSSRGEAFDEATAADGEMHLDRGCDLMEYFLRR